MLQDLTDRAAEGQKQSGHGKRGKGRAEMDLNREGVKESKGRHRDRKDSGHEPMDQDQIPFADSGPKAPSEQRGDLQEPAEIEMPNQVEELAQRYLNQQYRNYYN